MAATPKISDADLLRIKFDTGYDRRSYAGTWFGMIAAIDPKGDATLTRAKALLAAWDWNLDGRGLADALAALMLRPAMRNGSAAHWVNTSGSGVPTTDGSTNIDSGSSPA